MKRIVLVLSIALIILVPFVLSAQPLPYETAYGGGEGANPVGGGAPIGGGLLIMVGLAFAYGMKKVAVLRRQIMN